MPPLTYAQIRREKDLYGNRFADMSTEQYADLMNNLLGNEDYAAGKGNWFAQGAKAVSYGIDETLRATHLPQALGDIGQSAFGDVGRHAFEGAPRMAIDMLPFMKAGKVAMGVGAGMMALNTFEKTNSGLAAGVAAATAPLFGPLAKWGGEAAVGLGSRLGMNVARTQAGAAGIGGIGLLAGEAATNMVGRKLATSLATGGVLKSGLARGVEVLGQQTGMMGANLASQALVSAAAAPTGQKWDTVKQMFTTDLGATLGAAALTQLPFAAHAGARAAYGAPAAEVRFVKDYAQTLARYDKQVYGPEREAIAEGNARLAQRIAVNEAQTKLRTDAQKQFDGRVKELPGPGQSSDVAARNFVSERFSTTPGTEAETSNAQRLVGRVEQSLQKAIAEKNPLKVALLTRRLNKLRERAGMFTDDVLLNPAPDQRRGSGRLDSAGQGNNSSVPTPSNKPASQVPSTKLAARADGPVSSRPARVGRDTSARDAWDAQYGMMRKGGRSHNDDGTPYQPTVFDEVAQTIRNKARGMTDDAHDAYMRNAIGTSSEYQFELWLRELIDAGWGWNESLGRMQDPSNPDLLPGQFGKSSRSEQLNDPAPEVRLKAAMEVNGETPETLKVQVDALQDKGETLSKAAETVATVQTARAERAEALRVKREQDRVEREAARKAAKDAATIKDNETFSAIVKPADEVTNAITRGITRASDYGAEHVDILDRVKTAVLNWHTQYGRDAAKLPELERMIGGVLKQTVNKPVNDKSRAYVSDDTPTAPVATKGVPGKKYTSAEAANAARDAIKDAPDGNKYQWSVEKIVPPASKSNTDRTPHWVISRREWASTTVQQGGKEVVDTNLTPDELAARLDEEVGDAPDMTPQLDSEAVMGVGRAHEGAEESVADAADQTVGEEHGAKTVIENVLSPESLAEQLTEYEARKVGRKLLFKPDPDDKAGEVQRGKDRMRAALDIIAQMRDGKTEAMAVGQYQDLWGNFKIWKNWLQVEGVKETLRDWTTRLSAVSANKGKQFLSLTGNYSAGGGFWYNVGVYNNGKIGKHVLPKDGVIPVETFRKIGRGTDQPLTNDEVALYKTLVPEAFVGDKVNVKTFYEALPKREPSVEIVLQGEGSNALGEATHRLDALLVGEFAYLRDMSTRDVRELLMSGRITDPAIVDAMGARDAAIQANERAQHKSVAPKAESDMPGYVEGLVRVPIDRSQLRTNYEGGITDHGDDLLYRGPHFGSEDTNVVGFFRGYMETLPDGTKAFHVIEVQSDWAQANNKALKYYRENKESFARTDNLQSDADYLAFTGRHTSPLLPAYENLALKAAIKHARDNGATKLILSDAETAMMSEGHDVAGNLTEGRPSQEKGMRLHYDPDTRQVIKEGDKEVVVLRNASRAEAEAYIQKQLRSKDIRPAGKKEGGRFSIDELRGSLHVELSALTGDKGQKVDLGVHAKQRTTNATVVHEESPPVDAPESWWREIEQRLKSQYPEPRYEVRVEDWAQVFDRSSQKRLGSPVFKDANGKPKTNITGTIYDISNVKMSTEGSGAQMGLGDQKVFMGERMALGELARNVGLTLADVPELARLIALRDGSDIAYAQLQSGTDTLGLFTQQRDGQKLVWLAANGDPATRMLFAMVHEYNGHGVFQAMREGRLDAETTHRLQSYMDHISENSPEVNSMLLRELWTTLPKRYRKDDGLQKLVNSRLTDAEEVLSNFNAIISLGLAAKGRPGWISEALTWLPKPIGDAIVAFASWGRKVFEAINGLMFMRKQNWTRGIVDPAELAQLHDYVKTMHTVLRVNRTREAQLEQSIRMQMVNEPKYMLSSLADGSMWADAVTSAGDTLVKQFRLLEPPPEKRSIKETIGAMLSKPNRGLNHFLMPLVNYAQRYGWLRHTVVGSAEKAAKNASIENDILKEMGLVRKGMSYRADESHPMSKVSTSPVMRKALNDITWRANTMETTVEQLVSANDKVVRDVLNKLSPEQQTTVREAIARGEVANGHQNDMIYKEQYERLVAVTGESLMLKDSNMYWETAEAKARQIVEEVRSGHITSTDEVVPFVQKMANRIEKQVDWFRNRPYFVSARRFGAHSIRVVHRDGTQKVLDFRTAEEQTQWRVQNREAMIRGDVTPYLLKAEHQAYNVTQTALDMIKDLESGQRDEIIKELTRVGIAADAAEGIADRFSQSSYLQRELQARSVPSMSPHRKFVAGYESLDVIRQQIEYLQMVTHTLTKGIANARFEMQMRDPRTRDLPEAKSIRQAWQQNQAPDMNGTRLMQKAGYTWFMAGHLLNMLQDAVTPISGALYGNLVDDGGGVMATGKRIMTAMADAKSPKRQTAFERQMLERFKKGNRGLASFTDEGANDYLAALNAHEKLKGFKASSLGDVLTRPMAAGFLHMRNFHKHFTDFGMEAGLLAAFRHFKAKGLADAVAEKEAFALQTVAMGGGKYNRPAGLWASGRLQPLSAAMSLLQGFAYNQMFTWKNFFEKALGTVPNLSKEQRINATKAFATHSGLMFAQAGIFGIPMAAAIMAIIDKVFDTNSKENIATFVNEKVDVVDGDIERQIAMHGFVNAFGGVDYASKAQVPGVLGFNAQNGFSFESLAGPIAGLGNTAFDSVQSLAKGDVGEAVVNMAPNNFRRLLQGWKNDWEFKRKDGSLVAETTPTDKTLYALMGLRPRSVADIVERDQWQAIDANIERNANESWKEDMVELFKEDPASARMEILKRANERQESPAAIANTVVDTLLEQQMPRDAGRRAGASERVNKAAGVQASPISEMQRLQAQQAFLQQLGLGLPATPTAFERAMQIDGIRAQNPWLSYDEAVRRVEGQSGALQSRMMRGASFGMR